MHLIRQSTASTVTVGPVLDSTGAAVTSAVVGDFRISKNGTTATLSGATVTHDANGYYNIALTTGNTDTAGRLVLFVGNSAQSMGAHRFTVLLPSVFDALIANATNSTGGLPTATAAISAFAGAISTFAGGAVASVTGAVGSVTNRVTANVDQWNGVTATGMPMPTYTQPTGFLTATFPTTVASPTNITSASGVVLAGVTHTGAVIPTVTDVTTKTGYTATVSDKTGFSLLPTTGLGNQSGTVGGISGVSFPANFSLLSITSGGAIASVINVLNVDELGAGALVANGAIDAIPPAVWNALTTETYVDGSFGDRSLISTNNNRTVAVTGSGHVAAVLHDAEPNSIPEDAFQSGAVSARVIAADAATEIANAVAAPSAATIADAVWDEILVGHLGAGSTGEALNNSGGSGNPWITDIATGYTGTQAGNVLNQVKAKTDLITSGNVQTSIPVTAQGQIAGPLYIGDDYLTANGRAFDWTIALPTGFVAATATCKFGMIYEDETGVSQFNVSGTVTDVGSGNVRLRFELPKATTDTLKAGFHRWSVEIVSSAGVEVTPVAYNDRKLVEWREKQT